MTEEQSALLQLHLRLLDFSRAAKELANIASNSLCGRSDIAKAAATSANYADEQMTLVALVRKNMGAKDADTE